MENKSHTAAHVLYKMFADCLVLHNEKEFLEELNKKLKAEGLTVTTVKHLEEMEGGCASACRGL